jgi:hypothetical protein
MEAWQCIAPDAGAFVDDVGTPLACLDPCTFCPALSSHPAQSSASCLVSFSTGLQLYAYALGLHPFKPATAVSLTSIDTQVMICHMLILGCSAHMGLHAGVATSSCSTGTGSVLVTTVGRQPRAQ